MVIDSDADKQLLLHIINNFPMSGPYGQVAEAIARLNELRQTVEQAEVKEIKE